MILFPSLDARVSAGRSPWDDYWYSPVSEPTSTGINVDVPAAMSDTAVYQAVRVLAEGVMMMPLILYERTGAETRERARNHPLYRILTDEANPEITAPEFIEWLQASAAIRGNGYAEIQRDRAGRVVALWPLLSHKMQRIERRDSSLWYIYRLKTTTGAEKDVAIPSKNILHIKGFSAGGLLGLHPISTCRDAIGLSLALRKFGGRFFANGANAGGILEHPDKLSPEAHARLKKSIAEEYTSLNRAHRTMILEEGMSWKQTGVSPEDAQALESRQFQVPEVARVFNVKPHLLMDLTRATFDNIAEQGIEHVVYTIGAWLVRWEKRTKMSLLSEAEKARFFTEFLRDVLLQGTPKERFEAYSIAKQNGWITTNEIRQRENMNPAPGEQGEIFWAPLNMVNAEALVDPEPTDSEDDGNFEEDEGERSVEPVQEWRQAGAARIALRQAFSAKILAGAKRVVQSEVREGKNNLIPLVENGQAIEARDWLDQYYIGDEASYAVLVDRQLKPAITSYATAIATEAAAEAGVAVPAIDEFVSAYLKGLTRHQARSSHGQLRKILNESGPEAVIEDMEKRMAEWLDRKPEKIRRRQVIQADGAIAREIWRREGVREVVWHVLGDTCPFCNQLDGRVVGIDGSFVPKGTAVEVEGKSPIWAGANVLHPPLHQGCDCFISTRKA
jgi:HK97 family phage portal protein